jgi:hypothetical protein
MSTSNRVDAYPVLALGRLHREVHLLAERPGKEAAHAVGLPAGGNPPSSTQANF